MWGKRRPTCVYVWYNQKLKLKKSQVKAKAIIWPMDKLVSRPKKNYLGQSVSQPTSQPVS